MWVPLAVLAVLSLVGGWVGIPAVLGDKIGVSNAFEHFLEPAFKSAGEQQAVTGEAHNIASPGGATTEGAASHSAAAGATEEQHDTKTEFGLMVLSLALALAGIFIGRSIFLKTPLKPMPTVLENKWYVDELYDAAVVNPIENTSRGFLWKLVDVKLIDGFVNGVANAFAGLAGILRTTQTGLARSYAAVILLGAVVVIGYFASALLR